MDWFFKNLSNEKFRVKKEGWRPFLQWRVSTCGHGKTKTSLMEIFGILWL
jgi:hypothetical protein